MGSNLRPDEMPRHRVYLDKYFMATNLVTVQAYAIFAAQTKRELPQHPMFNSQWRHRDHPIVNVSWFDATAYCEWLSEISGHIIRLPTEAQWEKAARGTDGRKYPWGTKWDATRLRHGGRKRDTPEGTSTVGSFVTGASPYGVLELVGSVWQWCSDWYDAAAYTRTPVRNPAGPPVGQYRVLRGGSWDLDRPHDFRCALRNWDAPNIADDNFGFRFVATVAAETITGE